MTELNDKERKILAIAHNSGRVTRNDCLKFYRTPHHIKNILERLSRLGYITPLETEGFVITEMGKNYLGIDIDMKLEDFQKKVN